MLLYVLVALIAAMVLAIVALTAYYRSLTPHRRRYYWDLESGGPPDLGMMEEFTLANTTKVNEEELEITLMLIFFFTNSIFHIREGAQLASVFAPLELILLLYTQRVRLSVRIAVAVYLPCQSLEEDLVLKYIQQALLLKLDSNTRKLATELANYLDYSRKANHPPYSPDLAPNDFLLYPKIKKDLKGRRFDSIPEIKENTKNILKILTDEDFQRCFDIWKKDGTSV
ncbi:hypothetical protein LAZ67_13001813 [Cordylochernes scorpioides]|uniref:Uncharacterized protein n=1 Tax=Cordylochernes scorpioides TaxID=51811 RepID=A0ABY6L4Z9_9ARAC|nr:hypothetical protein LAZ67_13001813 [Cordylochernes scorpioides]